MEVLLTIGLVLSSVLLATVAVGAVAGAIGAATGASLERCDRCHRIGLAVDAHPHPAGCAPQGEHDAEPPRSDGWRGPAAWHAWLKIPVGVPLLLRHDLIGHPRSHRG